MNWNEPEPSAALNISGLAALTALEALHLGGRQLLFSCPTSVWTFLDQLAPVKPAEADSLPPSLTSLALDGYVDSGGNEEEEQFVPPQASWAQVWRGLSCVQWCSACCVVWRLPGSARLPSTPLLLASKHPPCRPAALPTALPTTHSRLVLLHPSPRLNRSRL